MAGHYVWHLELTTGKQTCPEGADTWVSFVKRSVYIDVLNIEGHDMGCGSATEIGAFIFIKERGIWRAI